MKTSIYKFKRSLSIFSFLSFVCLFTFISFSAFTNNNETDTQPKYSEVRIYAANETDFQRMEKAGLIIDHAVRKPGLYLDAWLSEYEISQLKDSYVPYEILVNDWDEYYNSQPKMTQTEIDAQMKEAKETDNVSHSIYGTMGGFLKYSEVVAKLDSMRLQYPQFISQKFSIGNTFQGRSMWAVRITKNPDAPTGRPEVFYNALIHAREPESMETQLYYFYWLFENYGTDPTATYILDNREIYWMPVFNADGYVYNETTNPTGGGMWRCNRHGVSCGWVDLNRNFGIYQFWNSSNNGSSTDSCSGGQNTYRGKSPFSEIETRNYMDFVNSRNFSDVFNAHTYGNYLIKPWAWSDPATTPDDNKFNQYLADMSQTSGYTTGTPSETVGYFVRGGADDWCYNDSANSSHHIFGITPETGTTGFWPLQNEIIPLAQNMLYSNKYMSLIAGAFVNPVSKTFNQATYTAGQSGNYKVVFKNKGLLPAANVKLSLTPVSSNLTVPVQQYTYPSLASFAGDSTLFNFAIGAGVTDNTALSANLKITMDTVTIYTQQVYVLVGAGSVVMTDNAEGTFSNWVTDQGWAITSSQSNSPTHSFTDSPGGNYADDANNSMTTANPLSVSSSQVTLLNFYHRFVVEQGYDYCNVEVLKNTDTEWQLVKSYTGSQLTWTQEKIDITAFTTGATSVKIRFRLTSDAGVTADGWYVDDYKIISYNIGLTGITTNNEIPEKFSLNQNYPNPFNPVTKIQFNIPSNVNGQTSNVKLYIYDVLGKEVQTLVNEKLSAGSYEVEFSGANLASGIYYYKLEAGDFVDVKKMMLIK